MKYWTLVLSSFWIACGTNGGSGDDAGASTTAATGSSGADATGGTADAPTSTSTSTSGLGGTASSSGEDTGVATGATDSTADATTDSAGSTGAGTTTGGVVSTGGPDSSTGEADSSTGVSSGESSTGESSTGEAMCAIADVEDTLGFVYSKTIDLVDINTIQASYYNIDAAEIVFFSYFGKGRRFSIDGQALGDVMAPAEALPKLDGASYDQVNKVAMLLTQDCRLVEADPVTLATTKVIQLDVAKFKIGICAGVAVGVDGDMYIISWQTQEMVRMTRDGQTELARVDLLALDLARPDGISLIAGSENFLVLSSQKQQAAILSPKGTLVVVPGAVGKNVPPLKGGNVPNSDAILTVCGNGHAWVCEEYGTKCHDYAPEDGDKDACACTLPQ
jgi:hypothetical protein